MIKLDCTQCTGDERLRESCRRGHLTQTGSRSAALLSCILFILKIDPWTLHFPEFGRNLLEKYFKPSKYDTRQEEHWHCWLVFNNLDINVHRFHNIQWKRKPSSCWKHTMKRSTPSLHFLLVLVKSLWCSPEARHNYQWVFKHSKSTWYVIIEIDNVKIAKHYCWYGGGVPTWCVVCCCARGPPTQKWFRFSCLLLFSELEIKGMLGNDKMSNDNLHFNEYLPNNLF